MLYSSALPASFVTASQLLLGENTVHIVAPLGFVYLNSNFLLLKRKTSPPFSLPIDSNFPSFEKLRQFTRFFDSLAI